MLSLKVARLYNSICMFKRIRQGVPPREYTSSTALGQAAGYPIMPRFALGEYQGRIVSIMTTYA